MTFILDQYAINHTIVAVAREMTPQGRGRHADANTLFAGGLPLSDADRGELAAFGLRKNYNLIFASFDPIDQQGDPATFDVVVTDGLTQAITLCDGRLWKRDRRSAAVLLFPGADMVVTMTTKGQIIVLAMTGPYHDHGYELARNAVFARAARKPGRVPVVSPIGAFMTVMDVTTLTAAFAAAA